MGVAVPELSADDIASDGDGISSLGSSRYAAKNLRQLPFEGTKWPEETFEYRK